MNESASANTRRPLPTTFDDSKQELLERSDRNMHRALQDASWTIRQRVALTCRILFDAGHDSGLAGQITARGDSEGIFYTQQLGLGFDEITADNLLLVDEDLKVLTGTGMPNPANRFHAWIYRARPDVRCIVHTHPLHVAALSMLEVPLQVSQMDMTSLHEDCAFLKDWPGVPVGNEEGEIISAALGKKRAVLLAHHGQLVAASTVEEACSLAITFERAAKLQLLAMSAGTIKELPSDLAAEAHDFLLAPRLNQAYFRYYARRVLRNHPDVLGGSA